MAAAASSSSCSSFSFSFLVESHAHFHPPHFSLEDIPAAIKRAQDSNVSKILCVSESLQDAHTILQTVSLYPSMLAPCIGLHPIADDHTRSLDELPSLLALVRENTQQLVGIGECGLVFSHTPNIKIECIHNKMHAFLEKITFFAWLCTSFPLIYLSRFDLGMLFLQLCLALPSSARFCMHVVLCEGFLLGSSKFLTRNEFQNKMHAFLDEIQNKMRAFSFDI